MPSMSKEYMKNYMKKKHTESITCTDCGGCYKKYFKNVHLSSQKHQKVLAQKLLEKKEVEKTELETLKIENQKLQKKLKQLSEVFEEMKMIEDDVIEKLRIVKV